MMMRCLNASHTNGSTTIHIFASKDACLYSTEALSDACSLHAFLQSLEGKGVARCVYIAPMPGLAAERFADWSVKFQRLGLIVVQLVGETVSPCPQILMKHSREH